MTLNDYVDANFPQIKSQLGWSDSVDIVAIVDKTLELYGVATEALATDLIKLHALADMATLLRAKSDLSLDYAFSADNASYSRQQAYEHVSDMLSEATVNALPYLSGNEIKVHGSFEHPDWYS